jgi:hypothetical protein
MRREDDARALELLRLRNENALLKHKYDALFHERLIKPGDVVVDAGMTPGKAQTLSSNANANANANGNANTSDWRGVLDPGARVVRTRVFRGATVRGERRRRRRRQRLPPRPALVPRLVPEGDRGQESGRREA